MAKTTTYRFPAADVLAAKAAMTSFHDDLVAKAAAYTETIDDPYIVFGVGKIVAGPKTTLAMEMAADPMAYLLIDPPGGITYADLHDLFFGAPRRKKAEELMGFTLVMLQMIRRVGEPKGRSLMALTEENFLGPLLQMAMTYTNEKVPQEIVSRVEYSTRRER
ncbi:hypothetical protein [Sinorhizobium meliloti]|uniref:hypothetical protein n=1 Tax=Rhizobium meliloti TaxID=382 RepID=UPI000FDA481B|nr:hypothetical protein [Sinorhizobium meliloti]RVO68339.1 hypothetical protein CN087_12745 [Sinorhizobium meliloti]